MAGSNITKPLYESLCSFRGKLTCFTEFVNLLPDDAAYSDVFRSFSETLDESLEIVENNFSSLHITLKREEEENV